MSQPKIKCSICGASFSMSFNYYQHIRKYHPEQSSTIPRLKSRITCPGCREQFKNRFMLCEHVSKEHDVSLKWMHIVFLTYKDFKLWLESEEAKTMSHFMKGSKDYLLCHRSGRYQPNLKVKSDRKRNLKSHGSNKIGATCPAHLKITKRKDKVIVLYQATHFGHALEPQRLILTEREKINIAVRLMLGVPRESILAEAHSQSVSGNNSNAVRNRMQLLTMNDLNNIQKKYAPYLGDLASNSKKEELAEVEVSKHVSPKENVPEYVSHEAFTEHIYLEDDTEHAYLDEEGYTFIEVPENESFGKLAENALQNRDYKTQVGLKFIDVNRLLAPIENKVQGIPLEGSSLIELDSYARLSKRHQLGTLLKAQHEVDETWGVESHVVDLNDDHPECDCECGAFCSECGSCRLAAKCTCLDYKKGNMCKHAHALFIQKQRNLMEEERSHRRKSFSDLCKKLLDIVENGEDKIIDWGIDQLSLIIQRFEDESKKCSKVIKDETRYEMIESPEKVRYSKGRRLKKCPRKALPKTPQMITNEAMALNCGETEEISDGVEFDHAYFKYV